MKHTEKSNTLPEFEKESGVREGKSVRTCKAENLLGEKAQKYVQEFLCMF